MPHAHTADAHADGQAEVGCAATPRVPPRTTIVVPASAGNLAPPRHLRCCPSPLMRTTCGYEPYAGLPFAYPRPSGPDSAPSASAASSTSASSSTGSSARPASFAAMNRGIGWVSDAR